MDLRKDIYFFADFASFPTNGSTGVLYVDKDTGFIYSWNGAKFLASGTGGLNYLGTWDANANSPAITSGVGSSGDYYIVGTPGTTNIDGISSWDIGDWIIFGSTTWQKIDNSETTGYVTSVTGTAPVVSSGGTTPAISIADAVADGTTKGAASFTASDFNSSSGNISIDYTNGQAASASNKGFLTSTDWSTFNGKQNAITLTTTGTSGAATFISNTLNIPQYAGGLTYFTEAQSTAAPNATVPVDSLTAVSAATDADAAFIPKGTGALIAAVPNNLTSGGNKRGQYAVDWQMLRNANTQVASGNRSAILGGYNNIASGTYAISFGNTSSAINDYSIAIGQTAISSGNNSISLGYANTASNTGSTALGYGNIASGAASFSAGDSNTASGSRSISLGQQNTASASTAVAIGFTNVANAANSLALGSQSNTFSIIGRQTYASGQEGTSGDSQASKFILRERTTDASATALTTNSSSPSTNNQIVLSNQSAYGFTGTIVGKQSGSTNAAMWKVEGLIARGANAVSTVLTTSTVTLVSNAPGWGTPNLSADPFNGGLQVQVVGAAATNIQWTATIDTTEVIYA